METSAILEKDIQIAGVRFRINDDQIKFESYPRRLIYKGREYILSEA